MSDAPLRSSSRACPMCGCCFWAEDGPCRAAIALAEARKALEEIAEYYIRGGAGMVARHALEKIDGKGSK